MYTEGWVKEEEVDSVNRNRVEGGKLEKGVDYVNRRNE